MGVGFDVCLFQKLSVETETTAQRVEDINYDSLYLVVLRNGLLFEPLDILSLKKLPKSLLGIYDDALLEMHW
jgi:hypothetical protein